jgi:hypothetical protein
MLLFVLVSHVEKGNDARVTKEVHNCSKVMFNRKILLEEEENDDFC